MEKINTENAKTVKELYLRNLSSEQSDYIQQLQVRFQKETSTDTARMALFGYCKLDERYEKEKKITRSFEEN